MRNTLIRRISYNARLVSNSKQFIFLKNDLSTAIPKSLLRNSNPEGKDLLSVING